MLISRNVTTPTRCSVSTRQDVHAEGELLVRADVIHTPGRRRGTQGALWPDAGGRLLAVCGSDAGHLHRQPRRLPHRGEDAGMTAERALVE